MPRAARDVMAGLEKKGFKKRENDHSFFHFWVDGKKSIVSTKVSHGEKEIPDNLLSVMARQVKLTRKQLLELIDCPLTEADYVTTLRAAGVIPAASPTTDTASDKSPPKIGRTASDQKRTKRPRPRR